MLNTCAAIFPGMSKFRWVLNDDPLSSKVEFKNGYCAENYSYTSFIEHEIYALLLCGQEVFAK